MESGEQGGWIRAAGTDTFILKGMRSKVSWVPLLVTEKIKENCDHAWTAGEGLFPQLTHRRASHFLMALGMPTQHEPSEKAY